MGAIKRRNLQQLYSGPQVLKVPLYSVFDAARYLQIPENTLRSWVSRRRRTLGRARVDNRSFMVNAPLTGRPPTATLATPVAKR